MLPRLYVLRNGSVKIPRCLGRDRSRCAEGKTVPSDHAPLVIDIDSPALPSIRLGLDGISNFDAPAEAAMSYEGERWCP